MIIKKKFFTLSISNWFLLILASMLFIGRIKEYLITFAFAACHEMGHIVAAVLCGEKVYEVRILPIGINAKIEEVVCRGWRYILIYLSGPMVNVFLFVVFMVFKKYCCIDSNSMDLIISINAYLSFFNLLPVLPLDGGRILNEAAAGKLGLFSAAKYLRKISLIVCSFILAAGIYQFYITSDNFTLFFVGIFILLSCKSSIMEVAVMNIKKIIFRRTKILKKGVYPARELVVMKFMYVRDTIKHMDFDRFHVFYVLDEHFKIIETFTEQQIFQALEDKERNITFEDLIKAYKY